MKTIRLACAVLPVVLLIAVHSRAALAQRAEPVGRTLRDPARVIGDRGTAGRPLEGQGIIAGVGATPPMFNWSLVTSGSASNDVQSGGLQVRAVNETWVKDWTFSFAAKDALSYSNGTNRNQATLDIEVDPSLGNDALALALGATFAKRFSVAVSQEYFGELDVTPFTDATRSTFRSVTVGAVGYYDWSKADGSTLSSSGATLGTTGTLDVRKGTLLQAEYDFNSDFNGEDYFSAKLVQTLTFGTYQPRLIVGGGKHNIYSFALKLPLPFP